MAAAPPYPGVDWRVNLPPAPPRRCPNLAQSRAMGYRISPWAARKGPVFRHVRQRKDSPMPVQVRIPTPLRKLTANRDVVEAAGATVGAIIDNLEKNCP